MARSGKNGGELDRELEDLPPAARWREWMGRVEAALFASARPVLREDLARVVGASCNIELILDDIRDELRGRPYEIVAVAGGWSFRTRLGFGEAIRAALGGPTKSELSKPNAVVLMAIAYFQPITRGELSQLLGREVSRDAIAALREEGLIAAGPRSPTPGAPYAYVTTPGFLGEFGFESLRDLPDIEKLAGRRAARPNRRSGHPPGRLSRPSCEGCWVWRPRKMRPRRTQPDGPMSVSPARLVAISL